MKLIDIQITFFFLLFTHFSYAQETVIKIEEPIKIKSNTVLYLNGLSLKPSSNFTINSSNELLKISTPLDPQSINRVYNFNSLLLGFEGEIIFYYDETEFVIYEDYEEAVIELFRDITESDKGKLS